MKLKERLEQIRLSFPQNKKDLCPLNDTQSIFAMLIFRIVSRVMAEREHAIIQYVDHKFAGHEEASK